MGILNSGFAMQLLYSLALLISPPSAINLSLSLLIESSVLAVDGPDIGCFRLSSVL